jgi:hypothetical protein
MHQGMCSQLPADSAAGKERDRKLAAKLQEEINLRLANLSVDDDYASVVMDMTEGGWNWVDVTHHGSSPQIVITGCREIA